MPKQGQDKNTHNKKKHTKLMDRKKNKLRKDKQNHEDRLKALKQKIKDMEH